MDTGIELSIGPDLEGVQDMTGRRDAGEPDPEVREQGRRRRFREEYKRRILREADACKGKGELGRLLRREGLYSSHLSTWRRQRYEIEKFGGLARNGTRKAGELRLKQLERENARLKRELEQAEAIIQIQKKASELLGIPLRQPDSDESD
jgi:transposase-like protein